MPLQPPVVETVFVVHGSDRNNQPAEPLRGTPLCSRGCLVRPLLPVHVNWLTPAVPVTIGLDHP